jgi:polyferredoxin
MDAEKQGFFRDMKQLGEEYVSERINLVRLQAAEKTARMSAVLATGVILGLLLFFVLLFLSLLGAYVIYDATLNVYLALGAVAGFYFLIALIVFLSRKSRLYPAVTNAVIKMLFEKSSDDVPKP